MENPHTVTTDLKDSAISPSWQLSRDQQNELEALLLGALFPVTGYMCRDDYDSVLANRRLLNGDLWPYPIALGVSQSFAGAIDAGDEIVLRDLEGVALAALEVQEMWMAGGGPDNLESPNLQHSGGMVHPARSIRVNLGGRLRPLSEAAHYDFSEFRRPPDRMPRKAGSRPVLAIAAHEILHRPDVQSLRRAMERLDANLTIIVPSSAPGGDLPARIRCFGHVLPEFPRGRAELVLTPAASRGAGPADELFHMLLARNYGGTHYVTGLLPGDAELLAELSRYTREVGMDLVSAEPMAYSARQGCYVPAAVLSKDEVGTYSRIDLERCLESGAEIPGWYSYPEVLAELRQAFPPRSQRGFTVFFTGLSGAGKSTLANVLVANLSERGGRRVSLLDGDVVRTHLSSELGFSKEHRDLNVQRIGYVASEVTKHGGIAVCAPIAPYARSRHNVRRMIEAVGGFIEVYVATPIDVCESRDRKGLYAKARAGLIKEFTGVSDPYEPPENPEVQIDTQFGSPGAAVHKIIVYLEAKGYLVRK